MERYTVRKLYARDGKSDLFSQHEKHSALDYKFIENYANATRSSEITWRTDRNFDPRIFLAKRRTPTDFPVAYFIRRKNADKGVYTFIANGAHNLFEVTKV